MPQTAHIWTRDEVQALPDDGQRYELVDGELLVSPSPSHLHQRTVGELFVRLHAYVRQLRLGEALISPADLDLNVGQLMQPDVFVLPAGAMKSARSPWSDAGIPLLTIEVLSPSTARYDRIVKRSRFQRSGVPEYWIVDVDARVVERWRPDDARPEVLDATLEWTPPGATVPLVLDLVTLFREVWGEA